MNEVEQLIKELCPEGVMVFNLDDTVTFGRGVRLENSDYIPGKFPVVTASRIEAKSHIHFNAGPRIVTITSHGAYAGHVNFWDTPIWLGNNVFSVVPKLDIDPKFLFYFLKSREGQIQETSKGGGVPYINTKDLFSIRVPLIPMPVQRKIVSILDKFTALEAELEAELEARSSQFKFFVNELTSAETALRYGGITSPLRDLGEFVRGSGLQKSDLSNEGSPALHYGQIFTFYKTKIHSAKSMVAPKLAASIRKAEYGDVIVATTSENIQDVCKSVVWLGEGTLAVGGETYIFKHELDPLYATYLFRSSDFQFQKLSHISGTKVKRVSGKALEKMTVSVPDREAQVRIGRFLSQLEDLLGDVNVGLPAEIQARRKQYEYYRNKLLTFKELEAA